MAKYQNSVYGEISGRTLDTVAATWKGIKYFRSYAIPANPNTAAQQEVRTRFKACIDWCKQFNDTVYKPYWSPLPKRESQFNAAVHANYHMDGELPTGLTGWIMHTGSMAVPSILNGLNASSYDAQTITWSTEMSVGESADDIIVCGGLWGGGSSTSLGSNIVSAERSAGTVTIQKAGSATGAYSAWFYFAVKKDRSAGSSAKVISAGEVY